MEPNCKGVEKKSIKMIKLAERNSINRVKISERLRDRSSMASISAHFNESGSDFIH
jgi:hypothetical protein